MTGPGDPYGFRMIPAPSAPVTVPPAVAPASGLSRPTPSPSPAWPEPSTETSCPSDAPPESLEIGIDGSEHHTGMAQPLAHVAMYLLEPESDDGFARWGILNGDLRPGSEFPVVRIDSSVELQSQRITEPHRS